MFKFRLAVLLIFMLIVTMMTWWLSDPPSFRVLWITIPGTLIGLAIEIQRKRGKPI